MFDIKKAKQESNFRELKISQSHSKFINYRGKTLLNLGSNDYLGIATNISLRDEFLTIAKHKEWFFGSGASRLVYTSSSEFNELESWFESKFDGKKATIFNSGYCANLSCISAINSPNTLFLTDKLAHASMIDALKLAGANFKRYPHNDLLALQNLLEQNQDKFENIIILTETIFSMDGDLLDIKNLINLKKRYKNVLLYIDEAHSFFIKDELGLAKSSQTDTDVDFLLVTLSKAVGGEGAIILSDKEYKDIFINSARSLIYSTAIPSINIAWTNFILNKDFSRERTNLEKNIKFLDLGTTHICPFMTYENDKTLELANKIFDSGYFVPAIRPPTVPKHNSRLRISLRGDIEIGELSNLKKILDENRYH
ncbi:aminotransferase class I/II-fold pyridoxal phosphate-dependent enzyme [Campylobacter fetus]|nr:aminotransferase class I/II-fold pyridoxal phosphate-dependent enzyme [Campylobacter fetus]